MHLILTLFFTLLPTVFCAAQSVDRLLDRREYDRAYAVALRRVERRKHPRPRQLEELVLAFDHLQLDRLTRIRDLETSPDPDRWIELHDLYGAAYARAVELLDLVGPGALTNSATPSPAELEADRERARREAGDYFWRRGDALLPFARAHDKPAARRAFGYYERSLTYRPELSALLDPLLLETRELGTVRVRVLPPVSTPLNDRYLLPHQSRPGFRRDWLHVIYNDTELRTDHQVEVEVTDYAASGTSVSSTARSYCERVLDYVEKVKKKVRLNDSTVVEKIEEIEHYKIVTATVTTYTQYKSARLLGAAYLYPAGDPAAAAQIPLEATADWSNEYRVGSGDARALPAFADSGGPEYAPSDHSLLDRAARRFYPRLEASLVQRYGDPPPPKRRRRLRVRR